MKTNTDDYKRTEIDTLAAAIIAAGMFAHPSSRDWTAKEIAHDAVAALREIIDLIENL